MLLIIYFSVLVLALIACIACYVFILLKRRKADKRMQALREKTQREIDKEYNKMHIFTADRDK